MLLQFGTTENSNHYFFKKLIINQKNIVKIPSYNPKVGWLLQWRWHVKFVCGVLSMLFISLQQFHVFITRWYTQICISDIKRKYDSMVLFIRSTDNKNGWKAFRYLCGMFTPEIQNKEHKKDSWKLTLL